MVRTRSMQSLLCVVALVLVFAVGCNKQQSANPRPDSQVAADIQNKINSDASLPNKQIAVGSNNGVVTLSGTVGSEGERLAAGNDASQVEGVKTVVNNLVVSSAANGMAENTTPAPHRATSSRGNRVRTTPIPDSSNRADNSNNVATSAPPPAYTPPAPPPIVDITIPSGTIFSVRTIEPLDSERSQVGDTFNATLDNPIEVDGKVVIPEHADVQGRVADVKSATHYAGASLLALQLTKVSFGGKSYRVITDQWSKQGAARGKNTAEKVGGGAAVGAIIGAIAGGGKGAAIGAGVGGGVGAGANTITKGQQIVLNPETVLQFTLRSPVTVTPSSSYRAPNRNRINDNP
jgi:BON domain